MPITKTGSITYCGVTSSNSERTGLDRVIGRGQGTPQRRFVGKAQRKRDLAKVRAKRKSAKKARKGKKGGK